MTHPAFGLDGRASPTVHSRAGTARFISISRFQMIGASVTRRSPISPPDCFMNAGQSSMCGSVGAITDSVADPNGSRHQSVLAEYRHWDARGHVGINRRAVEARQFDEYDEATVVLVENDEIIATSPLSALTDTVRFVNSEL